MNKNKLIAALLAFGLLTACSNEKQNEVAVAHATESAPATINYGVVNTYPHDITAFTEGFLFRNGQLYESTGSPSDLPQTRSLVGVVDLSTGELEEKVELDRNKYFGEGIVFLNDKLYQLTYVSKKGFVYDANTFEKLEEFTFPSKEGWGMTTDSTYLIMSDGTNQLTYLDPSTFEAVRTVSVKDHKGAVRNLNELEYINGYIYANIYTTSDIVKIDPETGKVVGRLDLSSLEHDALSKNPNALELNGIAYNPENKNVYVTGKLWPNIYEIKFNY
ncbi:glutaminyl-peptide cyclotransferase [Pontibacter ummariensis]|uniref:glutaminyl-peptide cyclotransferase n=1 Tax=Pontibacter ummariensis TaxID=1610492 RepID=UPI0015C69508|nr:glutaminyl-peptide cyclotransferase [Pontibacter ummariensis]